MANTLFKRKTMDQVISVPDEIIDVYVVEDHIWAGKGDGRKTRKPELKTVSEFLIDPVRNIVEQVFRQLAAPYDPSNKASTIGQGWWIQAEFGSGKSHLLSFMGALALGDEDCWEIVRQKEQEVGKGKRESIYQFWENGLKKKSTGKSKGVFVVVKTLVGQGGGTIGMNDAGRSMTEYILDAVHSQYQLENGKPISLYPVEMLADRFEGEDFDRYQKDLKKYLKDPKYFDEEEQVELDTFLEELRNGTAAQRKDCGDRLWRFYREYLKITPDIPAETEDVLKHMVERLLAEGYEGVLLILDEVSLFMKSRKGQQRDDDEKTLVVLSNRIAKHHGLPLWTVCSAQQAIESKMGVKNIIANDRLKMVPLLKEEQNYYDIVLTRVRKITDEHAPEVYYEEFKSGFSWVQSAGKEKFTTFFPFFPDAIDVLRALSYHLTTARSSIHFMHQTLKTQCKTKSNDLVSLWQMFDDVVEYSEDPSGTTQGIAAIKTKFEKEWRAYESARKAIGTATKGHLKVYRSRCEKILKTLFLYDIAQTAPQGLSTEQIMNCVMEWKDHDKGQESDVTDNLDHYEALCEKLDLELPQVRKVGKNFKFEPTATGVDVRDLFNKARSEAEGDEVRQRQAWDQLLALESWDVTTPLMNMDLSFGNKSIFHQIAPAEQKVFDLDWHGRSIKGTFYMRDLADIAKNKSPLPPINSPDTDHDYAVFVSNRPCKDHITSIADRIKDPRVLYWSPDDLSPSERERLIDFAAYRQLVADYRGKESAEAKDVLSWVADRLKSEMGTICKLVPDSYGRGRICAIDHESMEFSCVGNLGPILEPLVAHVLDAVYESASIEFDASTTFTDNEAIKLITGIVIKGEIPKGAKPNQFISAAENYGYALGVMKKSKPKVLDVTGNPFVDAIEEWLNKVFDDGTLPTVESVYKNFTGTGGPGGKNYGLSRRMIDIFLLCLVQKGKIRITLQGKAAQIVPHLDLSNLGDMQINASLLAEMAQIQKLKAPEGWPILAPYAAILLEDDSLQHLQREDEIQAALIRLKKYQDEKKPVITKLSQDMDELCEEIARPNPVADTLGCWKKLMESHIGDDEAIAFWLNALEQSFGYKTHTDNESKTSEIDDLRTRLDEWQRTAEFCTKDRDVRAANRYSLLDLPEESVIKELRPKLKSLAKKLDSLDTLLESTAKLHSQLLEPFAEVRDAYKTRYLQAYDEVTSKCEQVSQTIGDLTSGNEFTALTQLQKIDALSGINMTVLRSNLEACLGSLFATEVDRNTVERDLNSRPLPARCTLVIDEAEGHVTAADQTQAKAEAMVHQSLVNAAALLQQPALRENLQQGSGEPFIDGLLAAADAEALASYLAQQLSDDPERAALIAKYLKKIQVHGIRLSDFKPTKKTVEKNDVDTVVNEFRSFLEAAFKSDGKPQSIIVEFKE